MESFRSLPSFFKIVAWGASVAAVMALMQLAVWLTGSDASVLANGTPLLVVALLSLLLMMSIDRRPLADYGVFVGPSWKRLLLTGIGLGLLTYTAYVAIAVLAGVYTLNFTSVSPLRVGKAFAKGMTGMPLATTQQFVFSGYLIAMLRDRFHKILAVAISAAIFAALNRIEDPASLLLPATQQLLLGLFLAASVLGVLRLVTGSILVPTGLLAGWIFVDRFTAKLRLLSFNDQSPLADWLAPGGETRAAPLMAVFLSVGLIGGLVALWRRGEGKAPLDEQAIHADFKRVFPFSHSSVLAPLDVWLGGLITARFRIGFDYLPRMGVVLAVSTFNTLLTLPERLLLPLFLRNRKVAAPVFIVGVHRSGTTHLHNLLALDPQFCTTRTYHMMNPHGCVFSGWLLMPVLAAVLPWRRPMDNVAFSLFSAQEEELAMAGSCGLSPHWGMTFPKQWSHYDQFIFPDALPVSQRQKWEHHYQRFLQKLTFWTTKRPLLKSPYNTGRVAALKRLYPDARFVHICRNPNAVYRSNMHLAREGHVVFQLQDPDPNNSYPSRFLDNYHAMESAWLRDSAALANNRQVEIRFEDLEQDPISVVRSIYAAMDLEWTEAFERRLEEYLSQQAEYQKNRHRSLEPEMTEQIEAKMSEFMRRWGYEETDPARRHAA